MSWTSYPNVLILTALILCIDLELSTAFKECSITEITGQYYSKKASNGSGEILKTLESKNKSDCWRNCCELERCNFMMYSTVLKKQGSSNVTCFLFRCSEITKCKTLLLPRNSNGISIIGVKQENITEANPGSSEDVVQSHHSAETMLLSTIPSLDATSNISHVSQLDAPSNLHKNHHTRSTSSPIASHSSNSVHKTHRKFSEQKSHTTRVSLVISLIFGIFFFGTVVFIIGRRWSEQCFRRGYSRVDYLLNDYD
ncbi:uncharacterized protein LOC114531698 isoform X2 [Dendronephthya gigantea]|uniref:uncharacterized protein LOC114531698 isoform X2 n=1 Tax=Dendronephthya gigantea TaxID=151771 RepID=UPI00106DC115|nr:uncharacterized protein LOC114531698 isoform X2 [Dendronephthya gigantea]